MISAGDMSEQAREFTMEAAEHINVEVSYTPMEKQLKFHNSTAKYRLYSGCWGGGKTKGGDEEVIKQCLMYPGNQGIVLRKTFPELRDTTMAVFFEEIALYSAAISEPIGDAKYGMSEGIPGFHSGKQSFKFTNGSIVFFRYAEGTGRLEGEHLAGFTLGFFYIDEGIDVSENVFDQLCGRLRRRGTARCGWITTNPGSKSHWIYLRFFDKIDVDPDEFFVVETTIYDNYHLPEDYVRSLERKLSPENQERYLKGKWGKFKGQIHKWFKREVHAGKPVELPKGGQILVGVDHGYEDPAVLLPSHYDGQTLRIQQEWYNSHRTSDEVIRAAVKMKDYYEGEGYRVIFIADPSNPDIIERMKRAGLSVWANKKKNVLEGITALASLKDDFEIDPSCVHTIKEFESYKWKKIGGQIRADIPEDVNNHSMDTLRYIVMNLGRGVIKSLGSI